MGCFSKFFLFVLNFIVFGIGVAVIAIASMILANGSEFQMLLSDGVFTVPTILLILGIIVMLIGFFGCFGAVRESPCLLYTYAIIVLLLLGSQIGVVVWGLVKQDELKNLISANMIEVFGKYGGSDTESLDAVQNKLHCCGVYNYTDWAGVIHGDDTPTGGKVPVGCCLDMTDTQCKKGAWANESPDKASKYIYTQGCYTLFIETIESQALWLGIGAIVLALVQLFCVLIACGIGKKSSDSHNVY